MESRKDNTLSSQDEDIELQALADESNQNLLYEEENHAPNESASEHSLIESKPERVRRACIPTFAEAMFAFGFSGLTVYFMEPGTNWIRNPFTTSIFSLLINFLSRIPNPDDKWLQLCLRVIRSTIFGYIDQRTRDTLFHEGGHALTALSLFANANPQITISPSYLGSGGNTHYRSKELTTLGATLGIDNSKLAVTMAGTSATLAFSAVALIAAEMVPDNHSEIKLHLRFVSLMSIIKSMDYALSTYYYGCEKKSHDFCSMRDNDISPLYAMLFIAGFMLLLQLFLSCMSRFVCRRNNADNNDPEIPSPSARF